MANLDVALRLRLVNGIKPGAAEARRDLENIGTAARRIGGSASGIAAVGTAAGRLGGQLTAAATAGNATDASLRKIAAERVGLAATASATGKLSAEMGALSKSAAKSEEAMRRLEGLRRSYVGIKPTEANLEMQRSLAQRHASMVGLNAVARELAGQLTHVRTAARGAGDNLRTLAGARAGIAATADAAGRLAGNIAKAWNLPRSGATREPAGADLVMAGRGAIGGYLGGYAAIDGYKRSAAFDRRMTMIGQTADATRAQIDGLGASVHDLAQETATPVDKLAGGLEALVAQGRSLREALDFMPSVARTAAASGSEVDDIAKSADSVGSNFKIAGKEMQAAFDIMAAGGKAGQFELKDMARYLPSLAPSARAVGFAGKQGLADLVSMLQVIRKGSGTAEEAGTRMSNILQKFESAETTKNFKEMGVDLEAAMKKGRAEGRNLIEVLEELTAIATKGDLSLLPKLFKDQELNLGMLALMTYRGEWQKLSASMQNNSGGTVMRDLVQVTKDAQASVDRLSNSWSRFIQAASRAADAGGISKGLGDTAREFQSIAVALERINAAYAEGGLSAAFKTATGDAGERLRENRKTYLKDREEVEDKRIAELEADNKLFREKLVREGHSPESIEQTMRIRQAKVEEARRRKDAIAAARSSAKLADPKPLRMGVDPAAPIEGQPGQVGIGTVEFNKAFPLDLRRPTTVPLPPRRPSDAPIWRGIERIEDALGPGERQRGRNFDAADPEERRPELEAAMRRLAERARATRPASASPRSAFGLSGPVSSEGAGPGGTIPRTGTQTMPLAPDLGKAFDPQPMILGMRQATEEAGKLRTALAQDLSEPARSSMETYKAALATGADAAVATARAKAAEIRAALSFTATPTIAPRLVLPTGGASPTPSRAEPRAPASPAPRLQTARLRQRGGGGTTITGPIHVHGVRDVASLEREVRRVADRRARDERDNALHDTGPETYG